MKSSAKNIRLTSVDDLFSTEESRADEQREKVQEILLSELHPFPNHPFKVVDDERMLDTADSIREHGVLVPAIARPRPDGGYELIAGHRRKRGCELAGLDTMPVIVRNLDDDASTIIMVDSNIQRESLLPSERAFAYKMKLEALNHQGKRAGLTSSQLGTKLMRTDEILAEQSGTSRNQVQRYIRLTELVPDLLDMVDAKKIAFNPAVELSYLKPEEQTALIEAMDSEQATPSLSQAQRLKRFSQEGTLSPDMMRAILSEEKKADMDRVTLTGDTLRKYFLKSYTPRQMEQTILKLLEGWHRRRQQSQERYPTAHSLFFAADDFAFALKNVFQCNDSLFFLKMCCRRCLSIFLHVSDEAVFEGKPQKSKRLKQSQKHSLPILNTRSDDSSRLLYIERPFIKGVFLMFKKLRAIRPVSRSCRNCCAA